MGRSGLRGGNNKSTSDDDVFIISDDEPIPGDIMVLDDDEVVVDVFSGKIGSSEPLPVPSNIRPAKSVIKTTSVMPKINIDNHLILPKQPSEKFRNDPFYSGCLVVDLRTPPGQSELRIPAPRDDMMNSNTSLQRETKPGKHTKLEAHAHTMVSFSEFPGSGGAIPPSSPYSGSQGHPGSWSRTSAIVHADIKPSSDYMAIFSSSQTDDYAINASGSFVNGVPSAMNPVDVDPVSMGPTPKDPGLIPHQLNAYNSTPVLPLPPGGPGSVGKPFNMEAPLLAPNVDPPLNMTPFPNQVPQYQHLNGEASNGETLLHTTPNLDGNQNKNEQTPVQINLQEQHKGSTTARFHIVDAESKSEPSAKTSSIPKFQANSIPVDISTDKRTQIALEKARKQMEKDIAKREREHAKNVSYQLNMANKRVVHKRDTAHEIILDMDAMVFDSSLGVATKKVLENTGVTIEKWDRYRTLNIKMCQFRRRVTKVYDNEKAMFVPVAPRIQVEDVIIVYVTADEFAEALNNGMTGIEEHAKNIRQDLQNKRVIYLLEGLVSYIRKASNNVNNQMRTQVRKLMESESSASQRSKRAKTTPTIYNITHEASIDALVLLQVCYKFKVFQTTCLEDTAEWISTLTQDFSTAPYKNFGGMNGEMFDVGTVRAGANSSDCFLQALQHIKYVTPPVAEGLQTRFKNIKGMLSAFERGGPDALVGVKGVVGKSIGKSLSSSIYNIFTSRDPDQRLG